MIELVATADRVRLSFLQAVLAEAGIETRTFDAAAGSLWGSAIPVRLMVAEEDAPRAKRLMEAAERGLSEK